MRNWKNYYRKQLKWLNPFVKQKAMIKNTILAIALIVGLGTTLHGQVIDDYGESIGTKVKAARVAYITERLGLTPDESSSFWALHNQFEMEQRNIRQQYAPPRALDSMSDQEANDFILQRFEMDQKLLDLKKNYYPKFSQIISPRKVALFTKAEKEFRQSLLKKLQQRRQNNPRKRRFGNN
jgi:hypothetical protein